VLGLLGAAACLFSAGILTWCVFAVMAALRRSRALTVVSVIYGVLFTFWMFAPYRLSWASRSTHCERRSALSP
jgi:hypothetical protein